MKEYPKIKTLWARESEKPHNMVIGKFALPEFKALEFVTWVWTEKVDGTNVRVMWDGNKVRFGGKTDNAQMPIFLLNKLEELFGGEANEQVFEQHFGSDPVCLYGEGFGAKIQKGGGDYIPDGGVDFTLFDVRVGDWWLERKDVEEVAGYFDIKVVPVVAEGTLQQASDWCAKGFDSVYGKAKSEGLVMKPMVELFNRKGERIITKLKYKDFAKLNDK